MNDSLQEAFAELTRLIAFPEDRDPAVLVNLFGDPTQREDLMRPRSGAELRALVASAGAPSTPPAHELVAGSVAAFWEWARAGFGVVDAATFRARMDACARCELYIDAPQRFIYAMARGVARDVKICSRCGCFMEKKARMVSSECPEQRWEA
jgi:hypothetical protein